MKGLIVILGSPNSPEGVLSQIAIDRLSCAYAVYKHNREFNLLCTGGFGEHFNTSNQAHALHAKKFLIQLGVNESQILPPVLSRNTYEDAVMLQPVIQKFAPNCLMIVSSDFHMERVKLIFQKRCYFPNMIFIEAKSSLPADELQRLQLHEENAIKQLRL